MAAFFPPPHSGFPSLSWSTPFSSSSNSKMVTRAHLITTSSALRLGSILQLRGQQLRLILCSSFLEVYQSRCLPKINELLHEGSMRRWSTLESLIKSLLAARISLPYFFSGKESVEGFKDKRKQHLEAETSQSNSSNGRLWTNILLALNVLAYVAQVATKGKLLMWGAKVNNLIDDGQLWRLVTSSFLHGNTVHLLVNCFSLDSVGPSVEKFSGPKRFLAVYLTSAIAGSVMSYRFCQSSSIGASGAIFGLVGSLTVFVLRHRHLTGAGKQDLLQIVQVLALNMFIGLSFKHIDNWGHVGGLLGGAVVSWLLGPALRYEFRTSDGEPVLIDRAPIFNLIDRKMVT